ncbi:DUF6308 family protein [Streptomyces griseoviridis]|uniref:DUF6308 family protein n=1 Tax=Streptomyces griseoviridis TaxID=45398 RepID=UPI00345202E3
MTADRPPSFEQRLRTVVGSERAPARLRAYFAAPSESGVIPYTGSRFEHLGGGGDRPPVMNTVTAEDLLAVQTLSVTIPSQVALDLLEGDLGRRISALLSRIPHDLDMVDADAADLEPGSPADDAWRLLLKQDGIGWVKAGKLLARKRPRLLPVYDEVVKCLVGRPKSYWLGLHGALRADDRALHRELLELRASAGLSETVSALRVCDVVLWTHHRDDHRRRGCAGG